MASEASGDQFTAPVPGGLMDRLEKRFDEVNRRIDKMMKQIDELDEGHSHDKDIERRQE